MRTWYYWLPDEGETFEDRREWEDGDLGDAETVGRDIAKHKWHRDSPDYFDEITLAIVDPLAGEHRVHVTVEQVPAFRARATPFTRPSDRNASGQKR